MLSDDNNLINTLSEGGGGLRFRAAGAFWRLSTGARQFSGVVKYKGLQACLEPLETAVGGRSGRIRTRDIRFWRPLLYQAELRSCVKCLLEG